MVYTVYAKKDVSYLFLRDLVEKQAMLLRNSREAGRTKSAKRKDLSKLNTREISISWRFIMMKRPLEMQAKLLNISSWLMMEVHFEAFAKEMSSQCLYLIGSDDKAIEDSTLYYAQRDCSHC